MRHPLHADFIKALAQLAGARRSFNKLAEGKLILGNDNHIGDIGEYWVRRYYETLEQFEAYGTGKNCAYDLKLRDGKKVSVKTLNAWSKTGYGTPIRTEGGTWNVLAAIRLNQQLLPEKLAIVPLAELIKKPVFTKNAASRSHTTKPTQAHPRFQWWTWLDQHEVPFTIADNDLVVSRVERNAARSRM